MFQPRRFHLVPGLIALSMLLSLPTSAAVLEPDVTLEGFPFSGAASVAISADGLDLYAGGDGRNFNREATAGLVWLRRDPATGLLTFRRNYFSSGVSVSILGVTLSSDDLFVYVLFRSGMGVYQRQADGSLEAHHSTFLPDGFLPESLFRTPDGDQLIVFGRSSDNATQALFFDLGASGLPASGQILTAKFSRKSLGVLSHDLLFSGRYYLRRVGVSWQAQVIPGFESFADNALFLASPNGRYLYANTATGTFPQISYFICTFEQLGGKWVEVGRSPFNDGFERATTTGAVQLQSGDLYFASYNTNGGDNGLIDHYRSLEGGRIFAAPVTSYDPSREISVKTAKHSLAFSADGRHLYTTFGGEPMALLEVDAGDGSLHHVPQAAGPHSHFERPFKILPKASGDTYVLTPNALLQTVWRAGQVELRSSFSRGSWITNTPNNYWRPFTDLALTPVGGAGAVTDGVDLAFVQRDNVTGALRILNETTLHSESGVRKLEISPDGRHLYVPLSGRVKVYFLRRDVPKLVLLSELPQGAMFVRIAPNGEDAVLGGSLTFLRRDIASGELAVVEGPVRTGLSDAFFTKDGQLVLMKDGLPGFTGTLEVLKKRGNSWVSVLSTSLLSPETVVDASSHFFYQFSAGQLDQYAWTPQLGSFARTLRLEGSSALGGIALTASLFNEELNPTLALMPGEESLLVANSLSGNIRLFRRGCGAIAAGACLQGRRFRVELLWRTGDLQGPGLPLAVGSDDSQLFSFFDPNNWEVLAKVLNGCAVNGRFWVFAAASTDLEHDLKVTDTWTGQSKTYRSAGGVPSPATTDTDAFATCTAASPGWNPPALARESLIETPQELQLGAGFKAKVTWTTAHGLVGTGKGLRSAQTQASGLFYFFDRNNWEMQVKVLDGCAINGYHWVFGAATTDVGYALEVTEIGSGRRKIYSSPVGQASRAITDTKAFSCN